MIIQPVECKDGEKIIELQGREYEPSTDLAWLSESEQRELLVYLKHARPDMMREIFCEDCPEHIGVVP